MHNSYSFWKLFGSGGVKVSEKLLKSAENFVYPIFSLFGGNLSKKKSFLVRSEIFGLLNNTLTANYEYSRSKREDLPLSIK